MKSGWLKRRGVIAIDARWMVGNYRGMGRFAHQFIAPVRDKMIYLSDAPSEELDGKVVFKKGLLPFWEQFFLPKMCFEGDVKELICPYNTAPVFKPKNVRLILVVHDLIFMSSWWELPPSLSMYQNFGRLYRRLIVPKVIKKADDIVTVSNYTKNILVEKFGVDSEKITVISNSVDSSWIDSEPVICSERKKYLLTVSGEAPSKNLVRLLKAFSMLVNHQEVDFNLKILGVSPKFFSKYRPFLEKYNISSRVKFEKYVDREALLNYYKEAKGFVFCSTHEGFGIPLLEAMAVGLPVACSNTTSIPEVAGEGAILFNPYSVDEIYESMQCLVDMNGDEFKLKSLASKQQALKFSSSIVKKKIDDFWGVRE